MSHRCRSFRVAGLVLLAVVLAAGCAKASASPAPGQQPGQQLVRVSGPSPSPSASVPGAVPPGTPPQVISHGPAGARRIALTFDSNMTDTMLRWLDQGKVKSYANTRVVDELESTGTPATFFLASKWVQRYPELTRRIATDPNFELASHSYHHEGFTRTCYDLGSLPTTQMAADVEQSFDTLAPYGGHQTRYFRFPGGCYDQAALTAIAPAGCTVIEYDVVGGDPFNNDPASITHAVLSGAHPGAIVVLHVTEANAPKTDAALPGIISGLHQQGYQLVTLSTLLSHP
jgi:peptidoglycan/xylan/chitin deacetylase (PgdA/CDA1 family)